MAQGLWPSGITPPHVFGGSAFDSRWAQPGNVAGKSSDNQKEKEIQKGHNLKSTSHQILGILIPRPALTFTNITGPRQIVRRFGQLLVVISKFDQD